MNPQLPTENQETSDVESLLAQAEEHHQDITALLEVLVQQNENIIEVLKNLSGENVPSDISSEME